MVCDRDFPSRKLCNRPSSLKGCSATVRTPLIGASTGEVTEMSKVISHASKGIPIPILASAVNLRRTIQRSSIAGLIVAPELEKEFQEA